MSTKGSPVRLVGLVILLVSQLHVQVETGRLESISYEERCEVKIKVDCPSDMEILPTIQKCTAKCKADDNELWFIKTVYQRMTCLDNYGLMAEVKYFRFRKISCELVPFRNDVVLEEEFFKRQEELCPVCDT